ncbi:MAG: transglycosylase domain-containing protein [Candidatus Riflebacteria bacterium]|nr:transglycosylase domain-containing protein [Candidatus Riflebacteria bacterium]
MLRYRNKLLLALLISAAGLAWLWLCRSSILPMVSEDPRHYLAQQFGSGGALTDRSNSLMRIYADDRGDLSVYTELASHSPDLIEAVLLAEDRNFYTHPGFDLPAIMRAAWQNLSNQRVVSGASTISQQLIRVIRPRPRTFSSKIQELLMALWLEQSASKHQILEYYLNAVSMFGNVRGIYLAAHLLFGKAPDMLNLGESATLAAAIQAPGRYNPFSITGNKQLRKRRNWVLQQMLNHGKCNQQQYQNALKTDIPTHRRKVPFYAPHFCDLTAALFGQPVGKQQTTINLDLQNFLYATTQAHLPRLMKQGASQIAAIIANARTLEILAMSGSAEFGPLAGGFNNACIAKRSGGSVLKPFLYALALENGYYPSYVLPDTMQTFKTPQGEYMPYNANRRSYGPVSIRTALGNSLNTAAIKMINLLGIRPFFSLLVDLELLQSRPGAADFFGLGLAIGNPEIRMLDLVKAYGIFRNGGILKSLKFFTGQAQQIKSVLSPQSAFLVYDILADPTARLFTFGNPSFYKSKRPVAIKTGTSTGYRDCWLVAVNTEFIIALWVGNFNGAPTRTLSGTTACGPIYKNLIDYLEEYNDSIIVMPKGIRRVLVCSTSGQAKSDFCPHSGYDLFSEFSRELEICSFHRSSGGAHELPSDYASWIKGRRQHLDHDPFRLSGNLSIGDPWQMHGLESTGAPATYSSGPLLLKSEIPGTIYGGIKIVSPHDGDCYIMSASNENFALLRALPEGPVPEVIWLINGREFIRTAPPYEAYWPLSPGTHRISAITDNQAAGEIEIRVEH